MKAQREAVYTASFIVLVLSYCLAAFLLSSLVAQAQDEILPVNAPTLQTKAVHTMTADEISEILIYDIWKPQELDRIKIGKGAALGIAPIKEAPRAPAGWQAFVGQDAISDLGGSNAASAYGRM